MLRYGIDPQKEERVTLLHKVILQGRNLSDPDEVGILLGDLLAKKLQAKVGDRIVVTCTKAGTGELSQEMLRVIGLFSFRSREMDGHMAFIGLRRARKMMGLGSEAHEVVLRFKDGDGSEPSHEALYRLLSLGGNEALDWSKLLPDVKVVLDYSAYVAWILVFLLAALVALAILNTQFMALYERMFEFGVLRALGTHPLHLGGLVVLEASSLGFLGVLLGLALGYLITSVMGHIGFNYTGIEYAGVVFQEAIYPETRALQYTLMPFAVWVFTMLVACYPASHACRILPAKAMHRSLG
jgi:ABC-type lipoprotein release transport system permease subunit